KRGDQKAVLSWPQTQALWIAGIEHEDDKCAVSSEVGKPGEDGQSPQFAVSHKECEACPDGMPHRFSWRSCRVLRLGSYGQDTGRGEREGESIRQEWQPGECGEGRRSDRRAD